MLYCVLYFSGDLCKQVRRRGFKEFNEALNFINGDEIRCGTHFDLIRNDEHDRPDHLIMSATKPA